MIAQLIYQRGLPSESRADRVGRTGRARCIVGRRLTYIDHPGFHDPITRERSKNERIIPRTLPARHNETAWTISLQTQFGPISRSRIGGDEAYACR